MIVHVHATYCLRYVNEIAKNGCFVVKRYAVREAKTWRYAVRKAETGCHSHNNELWYMYYLYKV